MKLNRYEQETVINYNQAEKSASVYSHDPKLLRKLDRLAAAHPRLFILTGQDEKSRMYLIPKSCVSIRVPYSEERRKADSQRAKAVHLRPPSRRSKGIKET